MSNWPLRLPGAVGLGDTHQIGAWLLEIAGGYALVGAPIETPQRLQRAGLLSQVKIIVSLLPQRYENRTLAQISEHTAARVYAHQEAIPALTGAEPDPHLADTPRLLRPLAALFAAPGTRAATPLQICAVETGAALPEASHLLFFKLQGLAPGSAALLDIRRGYLAVGAAVANAGGAPALARGGLIRDRRAYASALRALLDRDVTAVLPSVGPAIIGAGLEQLRAQLQKST